MRHGQTGQSSAEYAGVLVLIAAIFLVFAQTDAAGSISGGAKRAVCDILGGSCAGGNEDPARTGTPGPSTRRPMDEPFPIPRVPWDGSMSLEHDMGNKQGLYLEYSTSDKRAACTLGPNGTPIVDLSVSGTLKLGAKGEVSKNGFGAGAKGYVGNTVAYDIRTTPENADAYQDGTMPPPNPVDPTSIPEGTTLTLSESTFDGLGLSASYRGIQASLGYESGTKVSSAVQRVDGETVRVTVGDAEFVKQTMGLEAGGLAAGVERGFESGKGKRVEIDLSTAAGRRAYASFVESGALPPEGRGVSNATDLRTVNSTDSLKLGLKYKGLGSMLESNQVYSLLEETDADGNTMITAYDGGQEITTTERYPLYEDGTTGPAETTIRWGNADQDLMDTLNILGGGSTDDELPESADVAVTFTDDQLLNIRDAAADSYYVELQRRGSDLSREDFDTEMAKGYDADFGRYQTGGGIDDYLTNLAQLENPAQVADYIKAQSGIYGPAEGLRAVFGGAAQYREPGREDWGVLGDVAGFDAPVFTDPGCE